MIGDQVVQDAGVMDGTANKRRPGWLQQLAGWLRRLFLRLVYLAVVVGVLVGPIAGVFYVKGNEPMGEVGNLGEVTLWDFAQQRYALVFELAPNCQRYWLFRSLITPYFATLATYKAFFPERPLLFGTVLYESSIPRHQYDPNEWNNNMLEGWWTMERYLLFHSLTLNPPPSIQPLSTCHLPMP